MGLYERVGQGSMSLNRALLQAAVSEIDYVITRAVSPCAPSSRSRLLQILHFRASCLIGRYGTQPEATTRLTVKQAWVRLLLGLMDTGLS